MLRATKDGTSFSTNLLTVGEQGSSKPNVSRLFKDLVYCVNSSNAIEYKHLRKEKLQND